MSYNSTIDYYNQNAARFVTDTISADLSAVQERFLKKLPPQAVILDFGCGSGRDAKYFLEQGCQVSAVDGSIELCKQAGAYLGIEVQQMYFEELNTVNEYDGIWACASVLHVPSGGLEAVFDKMSVALKAGGIVYTSFKYGQFEGKRGDRYFTDMTEEKMQWLMKKNIDFMIEEMWVSADVRPGREEAQWLNVILRKNK